MKTALTRRSAILGAVTSITASFFAPNTHATNQPTTHEVKISSFKFIPENLQVRVGDTIRWTNEDFAPHTATADEFGWDTEELVFGQSGEIKVSEGMETSYYCIFHPHMKASFKIVNSAN